MHWNQYQLVDLKAYFDLQLASRKKRFVRRCASFICFGLAATGRKSSAPPRVGPTKQQDILPKTPVSTEENDQTQAVSTVDNDIITSKVALKSSLKKTTINVCGHEKRRKVRWSDVYGGELVEIREFAVKPIGYPRLLATKKFLETLVRFHKDIPSVA